MDVKTIHYNTKVNGPEYKHRWWKEEDPGEHMIRVAQVLERDQSALISAWKVFARLYANQPIDSLYSCGVMQGNAISGDGAWLSLIPRVSWNVIQSCIDAVAAKIAKNKPRSTFLTSGADWSEQQEAKGLTKLVDGLFYINDTYVQMRRAFVDSCVFGAGWIKVVEDPDTKDVISERVLPFEILFDDSESVYGMPASMYHRKYFYREKLFEMVHAKDADYDKKMRAIEAAHGADIGISNVRASEMVPVYEGWHPDFSRKGNGRHCMAIEGATLWSDQWRMPRFPFCTFRWSDRIVGLRGQGLAEQLVGVQLEINKILRSIQQSMHLMSTPRIGIDVGSEIIDEHINNQEASVIKYVNHPPVALVWPAMSPDVYQHLERLRTSAYETARLSEMSATGQAPTGVDAAVALRELSDQESAGFVVVGQRYEEFGLDIAKLMVATCRELYEGGHDVEVKAPGSKFLETIKWSSVNLSEDRYATKVYPTSILPTTPAGRLQRVQEMFSSGILTDQSPAGIWARQALDYPDIEEVMSLQNAALDDARRTVAAIVEDGVYNTPEPYQALPLLRDTAQQSYLHGKVTGLSADRLELLRRLIDETHAMEGEIAQATAPPPSPPIPPGPPQGPPVGEAPPMDPTAAMGAPMPALPSEMPAALPV